MPKKIAAVVTEYRKSSHADVILRNLLDGYPDGQTRPDMQLVSLFTDQVPKNDMSRALAKTHGFRIADTIADALTLGGDSLAVEGVISIGEHGNYPHNDKGQHLYPRRRFFEEITKVFEKSGNSIPVFNDKHLAATWDDAKWMYDRARKLMVPLLAGSSIPVTWRKPDVVLPRGCELVGAVQIGYGPFEAYGFHALEGLQCMVERRKLKEDPSPNSSPKRVGGLGAPQQGVTAVTCHSGKSMWDALDRYPWAAPLLEAGSKLVHNRSVGDLRALMTKNKETGVFEVEYRDGFRAFVAMLNGWVQGAESAGFNFAGQLNGQDKPAVCQFYLQQLDPYAHFAELTRAIDSLMRTGHAPYPVERTLLTTGILDAMMTSKFEGGKRIETPHLDIRYSPTEWGPAKGEIPGKR